MTLLYFTLVKNVLFLFMIIFIITGLARLMDAFVFELLSQKICLVIFSSSSLA